MIGWLFQFPKEVSNHFWQIGLSSGPYCGLLNNMHKGMCKSTAKHFRRSSAKLFKIFDLRGIVISDEVFVFEIR